MSMDETENPLELVRRANSLSKKPTGFFRRLLFSEDNLLEANRMYTGAINAYRMREDTSKWSLIVDLKEKIIANLENVANSYYELQVEHADLAKLYVSKLNSYSLAVKHYNEAIRYCRVHTGNMKRVQEYLVEIAKVNVLQTDYTEAIEHYKSAINVDDSDAPRLHEALGKVYCMVPNFREACNHFETAGKLMLDNPLLKFGSARLFMYATLCGIATQGAYYLHDYEEYKNIASSLNGGREAKLIDQIFQACSEANAELFKAAIVEYDTISTMDAVMVKILLAIRKRCFGAVEAVEDELQ
jgi:tetratricopeptide (TPR) repeat protein